MNYVHFDVKIPRLASWVSERIRENAKTATREGTLKAYIEKILENEALRPQREAYPRIAARQKEIAAKYPNGTGTDSAALVRSIRDKR